LAHLLRKHLKLLLEIANPVARISRRRVDVIGLAQRLLVNSVTIVQLLSIRRIILIKFCATARIARYSLEICNRFLRCVTTFDLFTLFIQILALLVIFEDRSARLLLLLLLLF